MVMEMADSTTDIPIYELPAATNVQKNDLVILEQADGDKKAKLSDFTYLPSEVDANIKVETDRAKAAEQAEVTARDSAIADKSLKKGTVTIKVADVTATPSDDEFATETDNWNAHPYCYNLAVDGLTEDYEFHMNSSTNKSIADGTCLRRKQHRRFKRSKTGDQRQNL